MRIEIDGKVLDAKEDARISIANGRLTVDGKDIRGVPRSTSPKVYPPPHSAVLTIKVEGVLASLEVDSGNVECGNVGGDVSAGGHVNAANIGGSVSAGGSVYSGNGRKETPVPRGDVYIDELLPTRR